jgi:uncharacterized protein (DUF779 family)
MAKTHVGGGHIGKWRPSPLCYPQQTIVIENHDLQIHTIPTIYHTILLYQNCHEITYAPGLYIVNVQNLLAKTTQFGRHLD